MTNLFKKHFGLFFVIAIALLAGCSNEKFGQKRIEESGTARPVNTFNLHRCAAMTPIRPKVDILFVVDNSASTNQIPNSVKSDIANTVSTIGQHFDYHILIAPLLALPNENLNNFQLILYSIDSVTNPTSLNIIPNDPASINFFQIVSGSNQEYGFKRVQNIINANRSNNVFREEAYTLVVMISNGDDNERIIINGQYPQGPIDQIFENHVNEFKKYTNSWYQNYISNGSNPPLTYSPLRSAQFRFLSLVSHSNCNGNVTGVRYKEMSKRLYQYNGDNNDAKLDSYDLCSNNYNELFSAVNNSISLLPDGHIYDYWPINTASGSATIQASEITVKKLIGASEVIIPEDATNGWEYLGYITQKIRRGTASDPNVANDPLKRAEEVTAHMIKLNGSAEIIYPECILAKTQSPFEYFGYLALPRAPEISSIEITIAGKKVPKSDTDGWSYIGYHETINIKVPGPSNAPTTPALNKTGYIIKLNGNNYLYTHGDQYHISYRADD